MAAASSASEAAVEERLMISHMVLENFKSYAGVQEIGPFHKCFTSVVGPNGSGKSNVIDAMQFVFAKRAKQLRQNKLSELIHHSDHFPNLPYCKVTVHFQKIRDLEGDHFEAIEGSEFSISRMAKRDNSSRYEIDGRVAKTSEVVDMLLGLGIDLNSNRFLILQGEVEQISMMKPKGQNEGETGLLEYLEDIIGSHVYKERIEEAAQLLETLNEDRNMKLNRLKIGEKEVKNLEAAKNEAVSYAKKKEELIEKKYYQCQLYQAELSQEQVRLEEDKVALEEKLAVEKSKSSGADEALKATKEEHEQRKKEYQTIAKKMTKAKNDFAAYERSDVKLREDGTHIRNQISKTSKKLEAERVKIMHETRTIQTMEQEVEENSHKLASLGPKLDREQAKLEEMQDSLKGAADPLRRQLEEKQRELMPLQEEVTRKTAELEVAEEERNLLLRNVERAQEESRRCQDRLQESERFIAAKEEELQECQLALEENQRKLEKCRGHLERAQVEEKEVRQAISDLRGQLEDKRMAMEVSKTRSTFLSKLMEASAAGILPGVHGRLGDLGCIPEEYDVAVSTACPNLDNVVVENAKAGQRCVNFLKKHNLGRMTFILLDQLQGLKGRMNQPFQSPDPTVPRLFDLIQVSDEMYRVAFYSVMQDTLVAQNLAQGTEVAFSSASNKRFRVVTFDGQLIEISGTMSGGGSKVARGAMGASLRHRSAGASSSCAQEVVTEKDIARQQRELEALESQLKKVSAKVLQLQTAEQSLVSEIEKLQGQISRSTMDVESKQSEIEDVHQLFEQLQQQCQLSGEQRRQVKAMEQKISVCQKAVAKAQQNASVLTEAVQDLQKQINDIGGVELKSQKYRVETMTKELDTAQASKSRAEVQIETSQRNIAKAEKNLVKLEKESQELDGKLQTVLDEIENLANGATEVREQYKLVEEMLRQKEEEVEALNEAFNKLKKKAKKAKTVELTIAQELENLTSKWKDASAKLAGWENKMSKLCNKFREYCDLYRDLEEEEEAAGVAAGNQENEGESSQKKKYRAPRDLSPEQLAALSKRELERDVAMLKEALKQMKKSPNMAAIPQYRQKYAEYMEKLAELNSVTEKRNQQQAQYDDFRKKRLEEFMAGFSIISMKLKEMYQMITLGGDAELELVDSLDPFSEGIVFSVRPPKKSWKNISNLSGGEKTLSSLALVFALHHFKPTPLYVMDEIDAALDFKNVSIVANYIKERTKNAQFIIISLRNNMFELADRLVGIYKTHNCTKSVTIDPRAFVLPGSVSAVAATTSTTTTKSTASIMDVGAEAAAGRRALRTRN